MYVVKKNKKKKYLSPFTDDPKLSHHIKAKHKKKKGFREEPHPRDVCEEEDKKANRG